MDNIEKIITTGMLDGSRLPLGYGYTPGEIASELVSAGFEEVKTIAVEGIANALGNNLLPSDEKEMERLLKCIELTESTPDLLGVTRNIMAVGQKGKRT